MTTCTILIVSDAATMEMLAFICTVIEDKLLLLYLHNYAKQAAMYIPATLGSIIRNKTRELVLP